MQSRRHEDFASQSSFDRSHRNTDVGPYSYMMLSPHSKRSWSSKMEVPAYSERVMAGRRSVSLERRREFDDGSRRVRSRPPNYMEVKRGRSLYDDDWFVDREMRTPERRSRYEFIDRMDRKREDVDCSPKRNEFGYGRGGSSRTGIMEDKFENRRLVCGMREIGSQKSAGMEMYRSTGDVGPITRTETGADISSSSINIGLGQLGKERVQYPDVRDPISFDKYTVMKQYGDVEKHTVDPRDAFYSNLGSSSRSKEYTDASHFKGYTRTSPRNSKVDHLGYRGGIPLPKDNHPLNSAHIPEQPLSHSRYEHMLDTGRSDLPRDNHPLDYSSGRDTNLLLREDMARYRKDRVSPPRTGNLDSMRLPPRARERDDYLYPSDEIYEKMNLRERVDYNGRDVLKPRLLDLVTQQTEPSEFAHMNMSGRSSLDHLSREKLATNNFGLRSPAEKRESTQYLDPGRIHSRLGRKISREHEMPYMGMSQDREMERVRVDYDYDYKEGLGPRSQKERRRSPQGSLYESEHKMERGDLSPYDSSNRILKRKYTMDEEENRVTSNPLMSRLDTVNRRHSRDVIDEEWIDHDARGSSISKRRDNVHGFNTRLDKVYDDEEFSFHDHDEFMHGNPLKSYKYEDNCAGSGGRGGYNSYHPNRRNVLPKWKTVHINSEDDKEVDMYSGEIEQYEPHDDSDEFKQLVHDFFLSFTKKLNENPGVRRRYMEQGRAGSLFCIVCGRSLSKEFLDTQRLAMHAFMSLKGGLRAQHLGLLKAICVMLGWNSVIPAGTIRWFPDPLSGTDTSVQKGDLIIWPPVIIVHNTSISNNDLNGQGPTTIEALGQFLRGVGLSGGKVKPGKPANCSIMLVKFLGTFSALQEAEKIHKYFAKNKHGRKDLDQITSSKGKSSNCEEGETTNGDKEAERVLYGYMGIAEDLDKVDVDTKRKCSIKSKKEIQDLADGPVKPE